MAAPKSTPVSKPAPSKKATVTASIESLSDEIATAAKKTTGKAVTAVKSGVNKATAKTPAAAKPAAQKTVAEKKPATIKKTTASRKPAGKISQEERYRMIEVAAYFLAERSHFAGSPLAYWTEAESQIDTLFSKT